MDSFDREFRILFAASLPVPDTQVDFQLRAFIDQFKKQQLCEHKISDPPAPPTDPCLDWEGMGVLRRGISLPDNLFDLPEESVGRETLLQKNMLPDTNTPFFDDFNLIGNRFVDIQRYIKDLSESC